MLAKVSYTIPQKDHQQMKIAIVHPGLGFDTLKPSAFSIIIRNMLAASQADTQTRIFAGWTHNPDLDLDLDILPKLPTLPLEEEAALLAERVRAFNPDLVEIHTNFRIAGRIARALPDMPVIYYLHSVHNTPSTIGHIRLLFRFCWLAHTISVSHFVYRAYVEISPETASQASVIHNALVADPWLSQEPDKDNIILFCGRVIQEKGIEPFIQAVDDILSHFPDWHVVVLNALLASEEDPNFPSLRDYAQQQEARFKQALGDKGEWITNAPRAQIQAWMKKARIGIVPSDWDEPFCLSLLEMHLASCAVISSGRGGMKEVSGPDGALYLKEVSGDAIAQALRFLLNNPQERSALARRGHEYVMRHHRIDDRVAEIDALRRKIIARAQQERRKPNAWRHKVRRQQLRILWRILKTQLFNLLSQTRKYNKVS